ncbi:nuclease-related domain-containing protein [Salicibibacter cibarius]|uniref:nuclease-related domain-containing protein n=1 Tax=Salicibibacter cibarius TaxID=2743000 RepID=UPI001B7D7849|nr:nuclease-related domain-containing protein [Salicibibacter cibarius]
MRTIKYRTVSKELKFLRQLNARMTLPPHEKRYYSNLEKGFKGEQIFDSYVEKLSNDFLVVNDLLLKHNYTTFQIDSLIIFQDMLYNLNVKYYEGDHYLEGKNWHKISGTEIKNPLLQLERSESLLRQLLQYHKFNHYPIESLLIFVHPEFNLYNAYPELPAIFPPQLQRFLIHLNEKPSQTNHKHEKLANQLVSLHQSDPPFSQLPEYEYEEIKKSLLCNRCFSNMSHKERKWVICQKCGSVEDDQKAIMRAIEEFKLLFPERKITTNGIEEWCGGDIPSKKIRRILSQQYQRVGHGKYSFYVG